MGDKVERQSGFQPPRSTPPEQRQASILCLTYSRRLCKAPSGAQEVREKRRVPSPVRASSSSPDLAVDLSLDFFFFFFLRPSHFLLSASFKTSSSFPPAFCLPTSRPFGIPSRVKPTPSPFRKSRTRRGTRRRPTERTSSSPSQPGRRRRATEFDYRWQRRFGHVTRHS